MSLERNTSEEKLRNIEAFVAEFPEIAGFQSYEYFRNNESEQRQAFIDGEREGLDLSYPDLESGKVGIVAEKSQTALQELMRRGEASNRTESLYHALEYRFSEIALVGLASQIIDPRLSGEERNEVLDWFKFTNEAVYGKPDAEVFSALARQQIFDVLNNSTSDDPIRNQLQQELKELVGTLSDTDYTPYTPNKETIERLRSLLHQRFDHIVDHIKDDEIYDVPAMAECLDESLQLLEGHELGWRVEIAKLSAALSTSPHQKIVEVGENRKALEGSVLKGKVVHELGIHALRSLNALKAGWLSAAYGQEGYLPFEEAAATALENAYQGKFKNSGVDYYVIAGLAYGLDNHEPRDFREVYEIMWRANALKQPINDMLEPESLHKAKAKAFTNCMRLFRGTTTHEKGIIYSKDLAYFVGQELAWKVLDKVNDLEDLELLIMGKLDLTLDEHIAIANQIALEIS